jgi:hypothetical protein
MLSLVLLEQLPVLLQVLLVRLPVLDLLDFRFAFYTYPYILYNFTISIIATQGQTPHG